MQIINKHGILRSKQRFIKPHTVVLHHTAGPTVKSAEAALLQRGLAYHFIIEKDGTIYEYVPAYRYADHAYKANRGTIGVSFVGGGVHGPATPYQIDAAVQLCKMLKENYVNLKNITGHKSIDPRGDRWRSAKIDPRFEGEPENGIDPVIDAKYMYKIALATDLVFRDRNYYAKQYGM